MRSKAQQDPNQMWTEGVCMQILFEYRQWKRGFKVTVPEGRSRGAGLAKEGDAMLEKWEEERVRAREKRVVKR